MYDGAEPILGEDEYADEMTLHTADNGAMSPVRYATDFLCIYRGAALHTRSSSSQILQHNGRAACEPHLLLVIDAVEHRHLDVAHTYNTISGFLLYVLPSAGLLVR